MSKIDNNRIRIANDKHKELIAMWRWVQEMGVDEIPTEVSRELYNHIRTSNQSPDWLKGFVGFGCSFGGKWYGGYATSNVKRNYALNARNSIKQKMKSLSNVLFTCTDYSDISIPNTPCVIYCDIPYSGTTKYSVSFNHTEFYEWCYKMKAQGHIVLVSEYESGVPSELKDGFGFAKTIVWRKESRKDMRDKEGKQIATVEVLIEV